MTIELNYFISAFTYEQRIDAIKRLFNELVFAHDSNAFLEKLTTQLKENTEESVAFFNLFNSLLNELELIPFLTETGIASSTDFFTELSSKIKHRILPESQSQLHLEYLLEQVFSKQKLSKLFKKTTVDSWHNFFLVFIENVDFKSKKITEELCVSLRILSLRVAAGGLEKQIIQRLPANILADVFTEQTVDVDAFTDAIRAKNTTKAEDAFLALRVRLKECEKLLEQLVEKSQTQGTSLAQTFLINKLKAQIKRMNVIAAMLAGKKYWRVEESVLFIQKSFSEVINRYALKEFVSEHITLLSYQIAEHKSKSGEHYITKTNKEFKDFFIASCKGGIIINFVVLLKVYIHHLHAAPFWEAVLFSLNYAAGFILIHITHSALATKQPAMTASKIAASLDGKKGEKDLHSLAVLVAQTSRSQIISFVGNLIVVFPFAFISAYLISLLLGKYIVDIKESVEMLNAIHPLKSLAWLYAAFTGVFLFVSGIISGYWDNRVNYGKIPERIIQHRTLKNIFSQHRLEQIASYVEHNLGALIGNFLLGFFLGTAAFIGSILGWYFDIRHITIAAGNYSIGILGAHELLNWKIYLWCFIGVLGIGTINFAVSFALAFYVAIRSRKIHTDELLKFIKILASYFKQKPLDFFRPPKE